MIFQQLGGANTFNSYLKRNFSFSPSKVAFYTGSGLNTSINGKREDNYSTCALTVEVIKSLRDSVKESQNLSLADIMAVPGFDVYEGTFTKRLKQFPGSLVAKTGTLKHTSALAGMLSTRNYGDVFFGIFNHTDIQETYKGWLLQNEFVPSLIDAFGGPFTFEYQYQKFFPISRPLY